MTYILNKPYIHEAKFNDPDVVKTIKAQLLTKPSWVMSWGTHEWVSLGDALKFKVQGRKFKGYVIIILNLNDTFTILFGNLKKGEWILKEKYEDIYCNQMHDLIDEFVET